MRSIKFLLLLPAFYACRQHTTNTVTGGSNAPVTYSHKAAMCCESNIPKRFASLSGVRAELPTVTPAAKGHEGMVWIKPGTFAMGADNKQAYPD
jgi:formylglycine-generating enzyme required for sulfatase activity